jgi:predicted O-linked N-acetylglucosamine transferase (SPINDLY family)
LSQDHKQHEIFKNGNGLHYNAPLSSPVSLASETQQQQLIEQLVTALDTLIAQEKFGDAEKICRSAIELVPSNSEFIMKLGAILLHQDKVEEALPFFEQALGIEPNNPAILSNMAVALKRQGRLDESIAHSRKALTFSTGDHGRYSNLLLAMIYAASISPEDIASTAREFGERLADPLLRRRPLIRNKDPKRKLRIGYLSQDFRNHAVNYFVEFLPKLHGRGQFEIFAYSSAVSEDHITARLKPTFDHWRNIKTLDDDAAADLIEADEIDILIDISGHTGYNRLLVFARKPAPIQVTWLGYPATTGMKAMDYRITDAYAEPPGKTEHLNVETLWRLPEIFCCYGAHESNPAVIDHPPFEDNGYITFGCFNNFTKVTDPVLEAWAEIMARTPNSHLLLEIADLDGPQIIQENSGKASLPLLSADTERQKFRQKIMDRLHRLGLPLERVILEPRRNSNQFVLYNKIDIALDPFPCVGGTTSMDTLWMGVPLVTLAGRHFASRMGVTILPNAGLPELIARNTDEYIQLAADLASDQDRLRSLRHNLRDKIVASPLMNKERFTRNMEAAYREMWLRYCRES